MKIVLATPLYPPDIAEPASYVKELAKRLANKHTLTIFTYGCLPEKVENVEIKVVNKRQPLPVRLIKYTGIFFSIIRRVDVVYAENGASVELPLGIVTFFIRKPFVLHIGDKRAEAHLEQTFFLRLIRRFVRARACDVITDMPLKKPEVLPFEETSGKAAREYEESWENHLTMLEVVFQKYAK